jgi:hypothetical protein
MRGELTNLLLNPDFSFWDFGTSSVTTNGYTASRWKLLLTGSPSVSVGKGAASSDGAVPKWIRGTDCVNINVSSISSGEDIKLRQIVENGTRMGEQVFALTGVAFGPSNGHFYVGFNSYYQKVATKGPNEPAYFSMIEAINNPPTELSVDAFSSPSTTGLYKIAFIQLEALKPGQSPSPFELRNPAFERTLLNRYVYPISSGQLFFSGTSSVYAGIQFPTEMRAAPVYRPRLTSGILIKNIVSSAENTSGVSTIQTATNINEKGARLLISNGFSGLTNGDAHLLLTNNIGVFDADY